MAFSAQSKNTASYTTQNITDVTLAGESLGLLLALTQGINLKTGYSTSSKSSTSYSAQSKN